MIERIIRASSAKPLVALVLALAGALLGFAAFRDLQRDVFPDLSAPIFNVIVQNPALGAEELETDLRDRPDVRRLRSRRGIKAHFRRGVSVSQLVSEMLRYTGGSGEPGVVKVG